MNKKISVKKKELKKKISFSQKRKLGLASMEITAFSGVISNKLIITL